MAPRRPVYPPPTNYNPSTTSLLIDADKYRGEQAPVT